MTFDLANDAVLRWVRDHVIGRDAVFATPFGPQRKRYFDQTASGLPFGPIEDLIRTHVLPMMANTHTEASATGRFMTAQVDEAHRKVREAVNAREDDVAIFTGSGTTGAINKFIGILGLRVPESLAHDLRIPPEKRPLVVRSRMEHHSNDLPWRESIAENQTIGYDAQGRPDWHDLDRLLSQPAYRDRPLKIGTFSAASNVTGIRSDCDALARVMHEHGGHACFDFAAAAPYVDVDLHPPDPNDRLRKDAVFISTHKFLGGPQTPGLLLVNRALIQNRAPVEPGGGTVLYTSPWEYRYLDDLQHREEGGTPPIVQIIRAGLVFDLKRAIGVERIQALEKDYMARAIAAWRGHPKIRILGSLESERLAILSIILDGARLHHHLAVRLLSDLYGIQVRGGCMCAGTYGHDLLGIEREESARIRHALDCGEAAAKPGWVRITLGPTVSEEDFAVLLRAVPDIAENWRRWADDYAQDPNTAEWRHRNDPPIPLVRLELPAEASPSP